MTMNFLEKFKRLTYPSSTEKEFYRKANNIRKTHLKDLNKKNANNKLERILKENISVDVEYEECPLKDFNFSNFIDEFTEEELTALGTTINQLMYFSS